MVTDTPGVALTVLAADCVPILVADATRRVVAAVHAGRRGTTGRIAERAVDVMAQTFGSDPSTLAALIGPSVCREHYPVGQLAAGAARNVFAAEAVYRRADGVTCLDLREENRVQLQRAGIPQGQIAIAAMCTFEESRLFFSERRDGAATGRFAAGIWLDDAVSTPPT